VLRSALEPAGRTVLLLLVAMLLTDAVLMVTHLSHVAWGRPDSGWWDLRNDGGYGEFLQYVKSGWGALLLVVACGRLRRPLLLGWAAALVYLLLDDLLRLHETYGSELAKLLGLQKRWGESSGDLGEMLYLGGVGFVLLGIAVVLHLLSGPAARRTSWRLAGLFGALVVVGVGLDAAHVLVEGPSLLDTLLSIMEDGGELVVLSFIVAYSLYLAAGDRQKSSVLNVAGVAAEQPEPASALSD
jgi:hypothetical protein